MIDPYRSSPSWINTAGTFNASNPNVEMSWWDKLKSNIDADFMMAAAGSIGFNQQSLPGSVRIGSRAPVGAKVGGGDFNAARISDIPGGMYKVEPFAPTYFKKPQGLLG